MTINVQNFNAKETDSIGKLQKLIKDTYAKAPSTLFEDGSTGEDVIRALFVKACGGEWSVNSFRRHKLDVFEIIEMTTEMVQGEILTNQFDGFCSFYNVDLGSTFAYTYQDPSLFRVSLIAAGTRDLRRQRLLSGRYTIETEWFGVSIYTELDQFISGQIDFTTWINRVATSLANDLGSRIYESIIDAFPYVNAAFRAEGIYDEEELLRIVRHVQMATGREVVVYGTEYALRRITKEIQWTSESIVNEFHANGYVAHVGGLNLARLPQMHKPLTTKNQVPEFQVDDNMLLIVPAGERFINIVREGNTRVSDIPMEAGRNDEQIEFQVRQKMGIGVAKMAIFGMYKMA